MTQRNRYSKEFKLDAIILVLEQGYTRTDAGKSLGINANCWGGGFVNTRPMMMARPSAATAN